MILNLKRNACRTVAILLGMLAGLLLLYPSGAVAQEKGKTLFTANCGVCHYADSKETKVGPGLQGLSKAGKLPTTGLPVNAENLRMRIVNGGEKMPPFKHLSDAEIMALVDYLTGL